MKNSIGRCACGSVEFAMVAEPLIVHCCHCTWCQRETGSAFAQNILIETTNIDIRQGDLTAIDVPSNSGKGQTIIRCSSCMTALWSHYSGAGEKISFIRAGTLNDNAAYKPDIHIFTSTKRPWVIIPDDAVSVPNYYDPKQIWSESSQERWLKLMHK